MEGIMKNKFTICIFLFFIFTFGFIFPAFSLQDDKPIVTISPKAAVELIVQRKGDANFVIIDIRTPREYKSGHLSGFYPD
jgi:hypothetical protein